MGNARILPISRPPALPPSWITSSFRHSPSPICHPPSGEARAPHPSSLRSHPSSEAVRPTPTMPTLSDMFVPPGGQLRNCCVLALRITLYPSRIMARGDVGVRAIVDDFKVERIALIPFPSRCHSAEIRTPPSSSHQDVSSTLRACEHYERCRK